MKFNLATMLILVAWIAFSLALSTSKQLWFNDLYVFIGYLIWAGVFALAFSTDGNRRLFWLTVGISCVVIGSDPFQISFVSGWVANLCDVNSGGTEYGSFGSDKLFSHSGSEDGIPSTIFWSLQKINGPLLVGAIAGIARIHLARWIILVSLLPFAICFGLFVVFYDPRLIRVTEFSFSILVILSLTIPLTSSPSRLKFWTGYAAGVGAMALAVGHNPRFINRNLQQLLHSIAHWFPRYNELSEVNSMVSVLMPALVPLSGLIIGVMFHLCAAKANGELNEYNSVEH